MSLVNKLTREIHRMSTIDTCWRVINYHTHIYIFTYLCKRPECGPRVAGCGSHCRAA